MGWRNVTAAAALLTASAMAAAATERLDWAAVEATARGQTVHWAAWAGEPRINAYIAWVGDEVRERYGVELVHLRLADTAEAVARVLAERAVGNVDDGAVDLVWINGDNFASMKDQGLLFGPWAEDLPNFRLTNPDANPGVRFDFTVPVEGMEAPWGEARLVFFHDTAIEPDPPRTIPDLRTWAEANPGRFTYPLVPNFLGTTFLKQTLLELTEDVDALYRPIDEATDDAAIAAPLWAYLDALHPHLWRGGRDFPASGAALRQLVGDGELTIGFDFDPVAASAGIAAGELPPTVRSFVLEGGTIGNVNFVAIPFNSAATEGAMVVANFLLSPEAQARKQDPEVWGGFTVLDLDVLEPEDRRLFDALDLGVATLAPDELGPQLQEPHPSWMVRLAEEWVARYGAR